MKKATVPPEARKAIEYGITEAGVVTRQVEGEAREDIGAVVGDTMQYFSDVARTFHPTVSGWLEKWGRPVTEVVVSPPTGGGVVEADSTTPQPAAPGVTISQAEYDDLKRAARPAATPRPAANMGVPAAVEGHMEGAVFVEKPEKPERARPETPAERDAARRALAMVSGKEAVVRPREARTLEVRQREYDALAPLVREAVDFVRTKVGDEVSAYFGPQLEQNAPRIPSGVKHADKALDVVQYHARYDPAEFARIYGLIAMGRKEVTAAVLDPNTNRMKATRTQVAMAIARRQTHYTAKLDDPAVLEVKE